MQFLRGPEQHGQQMQNTVVKHPVRSVYFTSLLLENIRCFSKRQKLSFDADNGQPAPWTLILGDNGVGKTTLLQCLARMQPVFNRPPDKSIGPDPDPVEPEFASEANNDILNSFARSGANTIARVEAQLSCGVPLTGTEQTCTGKICTRLMISRSDNQLTGFDSGGELKMTVEEPLVLAYGAGRHPKANNLGMPITNGAMDSLFTMESSLHDAEDLLYRLEFGSLKNDKTALKHLSGLKNMLVAMLPDVEGADDIEILGPSISVPSGDHNGVWVTTAYGKVPFTQLSLGYQTVFSWTLDIAWRLLQRYPDSKNPFREPAIVIVDEIDLHLHPRWQRAIRGHLTEHFPNIQFIATAHSPLMAQCSLGDNLAVLRKVDDHVEILNDPAIIKEWRLDQVVTSDLFGLGSARSPEMERLLERRQELSRRRTRSPLEQRELEQLDAKVGDFPTAESSEDHRAMDIIRRAAAALKETGVTS